MKLILNSLAFLLFIYLALEVRMTQATCTAGGNECDGIPNTSCDVATSICRCNPNYSLTEDRRRCLANAGQPCTTNAQCINDLCVTQDGTKKCSIKLGTTCTANGNECVSILNSLCMPTVLRCNCQANYTATSDLLQCKLNSGQPCTNGTQCLSKVCSDEGGIMKCSGAFKGVSLSFLLMTATLVTSRFL